MIQKELNLLILGKTLKTNKQIDWSAGIQQAGRSLYRNKLAIDSTYFGTPSYRSRSADNQPLITPDSEPKKKNRKRRKNWKQIQKMKRRAGRK